MRSNRCGELYTSKGRGNAYRTVENIQIGSKKIDSCKPLSSGDKFYSARVEINNSLQPHLLCLRRHFSNDWGVVYHVIQNWTFFCIMNTIMKRLHSYYRKTEGCMSRCRWTTCRRASFCFKYCVLHYYLQYKYKRRIYCGRKKLQIVATPATIELQEHFPLMDMASNFVKELRDLVKKKPKNGTVPSLSSVDDEEETDSPLTPRKFEQSFLDGKCKLSHEGWK